MRYDGKTMSAIVVNYGMTQIRISKSKLFGVFGTIEIDIYERWRGNYSISKILGD